MTSEVLENPHKGPQQKRSRARRAALVKHGATLLNDRDLDQISVSEITEGLGFSTGSFYSYFADKTAFFVAVQEWVNARQDAEIAGRFESAAVRDLALPDRLAACVEFAARYFRAHTGVLRSALRYERRIPAGWAPNRRTTKRIIAGACQGLEPGDRHRLEIAIQLAFGMLVNALLHDPGPLRLHDRALEPEIISALSPYLSEPTKSGREQ